MFFSRDYYYCHFLFLVFFLFFLHLSSVYALYFFIYFAFVLFFVFFTFSCLFFMLPFFLFEVDACSLRVSQRYLFSPKFHALNNFVIIFYFCYVFYVFMFIFFCFVIPIVNFRLVIRFKILCL